MTWPNHIRSSHCRMLRLYTLPTLCGSQGPHISATKFSPELVECHTSHPTQLCLMNMTFIMIAIYRACAGKEQQLPFRVNLNWCKPHDSPSLHPHSSSHPALPQPPTLHSHSILLTVWIKGQGNFPPVQTPFLPKWMDFTLFQI